MVYLDSVPGAPLPPAHGRPSLEQLNERFVPHLLPVLVGSTVDFPNRDPVFHNVFSLSSTRAFDLGRYPKGESKSVRFDKAGVVQVFCHIHSDMSAIILVLKNAHFTVPDKTGSFALEEVPPGKYRVVVWHERIRPAAHTVEVRPGETTAIDFTIPLPAEPAP